MNSTIWTLFGCALALVSAAYVRAARRATRAEQRTASAALRAQEGESLLAAVIESAPDALLLLRAMGTIVLGNPAARELLFEGVDPIGRNMVHLLAEAPAPFRDALLRDQDALFTVGSEGEDETYHLSKRPLRWNGEEMTLLQIRHMTRALRRQEVAVWKKLLRVISHELNNSLAPISSLAHSARAIAKNPDKLHLLDDVYATIEDRAAHLKTFLEGYATLARLPDPRPAHVSISDLMARMREARPNLKLGEVLHGTGWLDRMQLEQLLLNLIKNAEETESPEVELSSRRADEGIELMVRDRGPGMSPEVLRSALLPFYSTKARGTGLGLALCREIVEAHNGKIRVANREQGGLEVVCFFPDARVSANTQARLTLREGPTRRAESNETTR